MMIKNLLLTSFSAVAYSQSLTEVLTNNTDLSQLAGLVSSQPQLAQALSGAQNITILAPNNAAISTLLNSTAGKAFAADPGAVAALLSYHVLNGTVFSSQISSKAAFVPTLLTNTTYANVTGGQRVEAISVKGNATIYSGLLNNATVVTANQNFTGGTIHIINHVLTIPQSVSTTLLGAGLTSLYGALNSSGLLSAANSLRDVTIFAPSNAAFQAIGGGLGNLSQAQLTSILEYHVHNGSRPLYSTDLSDGRSVSTLSGTNLTIHAVNGTLFANGAKIVTPDVLVAGGVVHVIDNVLNPANATASPAANATSGAAAFSGASSVSSAPFTSGQPSASTTLGGGGAASATATSSSSSSSSKGAAMPMRTGAVGAAALFGAGAVFIGNL